jgi:hypothetical protein
MAKNQLKLDKRDALCAKFADKRAALKPQEIGAGLIYFRRMLHWYV